MYFQYLSTYIHWGFFQIVFYFFRTFKGFCQCIIIASSFEIEFTRFRVNCMPYPTPFKSSERGERNERLLFLQNSELMEPVSIKLWDMKGQCTSRKKRPLWISAILDSVKTPKSPLTPSNKTSKQKLPYARHHNPLLNTNRT